MFFTYGLFFLSMVFVSLGDIIGKYWVKYSSFTYFLIAVICYALCSVCWMPLLRTKGLTVATVMWTGMSILMSTIIAAYYGEVLTPHKILGVALAIAGIILLNIG